MRIRYLKATQAWCLMFGDAPQVIYDRYGEPLGSLFETIKELDLALELCGLRRNGSRVETIHEGGS